MGPSCSPHPLPAFPGVGTCVGGQCPSSCFPATLFQGLPGQQLASVPSPAAPAVQITDALRQGRRPRIPDRYSLPGPHLPDPQMLNKYVDLLERCWTQEPVRRPDFNEVISDLEAIARTV